MSAQDHQGSGPKSGAPASAQPGSAPVAPVAAQPGAEQAEANQDGGIAPIASHGENATSAYVAPIQVPKRQQRLKTMDMAKVRISADMKVEVNDARNLPTTRMEVPPGGLRPLPLPPPPPQAELADPASSPWSQTGSIDRSLLPSAALGSTSLPSTSRPPAPAPSGDEEEGSRSIGIWIGVVIIAALLGGGAAYLLRGKPPSSPSGVSSSAPIAVTVPATGKSPLGPATPSTSEPSEDEPTTPEATEDAGAGAAPTGTGQPTSGTKGVVPRKTTTKTTPTTTATPTTTGSAPRRLFN